MPGEITYYCYDLMSSILQAELPFTGVKWSQKMNTAGTMSGDLNLADPKLKDLNALNATRSSRSLLIVDIDGSIVWGGIIWGRPYDSVTRILSVSASEAWSYFGKRCQARDYTSPPTGGPGSAYWSANPAPAEHIAAALIADAIARAGSALSGMVIDIIETEANGYPITQSYPGTQSQTLDSMIGMMVNSGYLTGFDIAIDWRWSGLQGSTPIPTLSLNYPRRGRVAGSTGLVVDASTGPYAWPEDGSQQANQINGMASGAGSYTVQAGPEPSVLDAGYPLLEAVASFSQVNSQSALNAAANGEQAVKEWPVVVPTFDLPMFGDILSIGDFLLGDDSRLIIDPDERFPDGLDTFMRIVALDANPADQGQSRMTLTLAAPPGLAPVPAPPM